MKQRRGFSLIELLTVLAVLSVVTTIGTTMFFKVNDLWRMTSIRGQLDDAMGNVDEQLTRDFGMVLSSTLSGVPLRGVRRETDVPEGNLFRRLNDDWLVIPVEEVDIKSGVPRRYNVIYQVQRNNEESAAGVLIRARRPLGEPVPGKLGGMEVATGVLSMRCEYLDGGKWVDAWSGDGMPEAVRVSLTLADASQPWEQVSRVLTYPIHVK